MVIKYRTHNASFIMATKYYDHFEFWQWRWQATINTRKGFTMYLFKHDSYYNSGVTWIKFKKKQKQKRKKGFSQNSFFLVSDLHGKCTVVITIEGHWQAVSTMWNHSKARSYMKFSGLLSLFFFDRCITATSVAITHTILGWRMWTCCSCRPSSATIVGHCHVRCSTKQHSSRQSGISSCWTTVVEQPSVQPATVWPYPPAVPLGVKDVFVWLTGTPAPSEFCL